MKKKILAQLFSHLVPRTSYLALLIMVTVLPMRAATVVWYDGHSPVGYVTQQNYSPMVETALKMFANDMLAVTGKQAKASANGKIEVIELNQLTNKEFKKMQKRKLPYEKVIAKKEAFYIGVHNGRLVVIGDDARGTAYGILELSRMAGVSPWTWWGDVVPERKKRLETDEKFTTLQRPSVAYRGICLDHTDKSLLQKTSHQIFELLLRLRGNTIWTTAKGEAAAFLKKKENREAADMFDFIVDKGEGNKHSSKKNEANDMWRMECGATTQPGLLYYEMYNACMQDTRHMWIANVHHPKTEAYALSLFFDVAWDINKVAKEQGNRITGGELYLESWLKQQFGKECGHKLLPVMRKFYELIAVCKPEYIDRSSFNALTFGNELERYLGEYSVLRQMAENIGKSIRPELKDAYFASVLYPIQTASAMAVKHLEAQESRQIARKESFHRDSEALESAARSMKAWRELHQLVHYYNKVLGRGKWNGLMPEASGKQPAYAAPTLPDALSEDEISKYGVPCEYEMQINTDGCVARNAADYTSCSKGALVIPMLGRSMCAVVLPKDGKLTYQFNTAKQGTAKLYVSVLSTRADSRIDNRFAVSIDGSEPVVFSLKEPPVSERWKTQELNGQVIRELTVPVSVGAHQLVIKALDDELIIDQWMLDFNMKRQFYRFPL